MLLMIYDELFTTQHRRVFVLRVMIHGSGDLCDLNSHPGGEDSGANAHHIQEKVRNR